MDLERIRDEWVARYNMRLRALSVLGLSVGTPKEDVAERYEVLHARLELYPDSSDQLEAIDEAFAVLSNDQ